MTTNKYINIDNYNDEKMSLIIAVLFVTVCWH